MYLNVLNVNTNNFNLTSNINFFHSDLTFTFIGGEATKRKWEDIKNSAIKGLLDEIPADVYVKNYKTLKQIATDNLEPPPDLEGDNLTVGLWLHGSTGTGKTRYAKKYFPQAYNKVANNKWWDGYKGQDYVLMDDLDKKHDYMGYHLKIWADRYAFTAEVKGGTIMIRPKAIIVTSNYHPKEIWDDNNTLDPILRRFKVMEFPIAAVIPPPILQPPSPFDIPDLSRQSVEDRLLPVIDDLDRFYTNILDD